ncbi:putative integral membrane protein [Babesia bovis T2Bo]|uniref:Uncharacterized protein n=1 Tax=Babesia bovis TaxID=5865 RepID=A7APJ6_BABBO|nr:putative integral membrane protein [Babesia bovis T2Bo]EDO08480.1 putative integral membrane protein [Babesia bovis T2Bo]|eukprot:XP_001612048.1 hypothetical protein [Babesia bovis T2Bo]
MVLTEPKGAVHTNLKPFHRNDDVTHRHGNIPNETSEIQHLAKMKTDIDAAILRIQQSLQSKTLTQPELQKIVDIKQNANIKLDSANNKLNDLIKTVNVNTNRVVALQVQRYRRIFDQLTGEFALVTKQVDQRYRSFTLFGDDRHAVQPPDVSSSVGQVVVEAIMDVESLTEQAVLNLGILKRGNTRMAKIVGRLNTMVHHHLVDIHKIQRNINYVLIRNRTVTSIVLGFCLFLVIYKLILSKII